MTGAFIIPLNYTSYNLPLKDFVTQEKVIDLPPNKALQATGAAPSVLDGQGGSLLPGFVAASLPAPVPELWR